MTTAKTPGPPPSSRREHRRSPRAPGGTGCCPRSCCGVCNADSLKPPDSKKVPFPDAKTARGFGFVFPRNARLCAGPRARGHVSGFPCPRASSRFCVHVRVRARTHTHKHAHTCTHTHIHGHAHTHLCAHTRTHARTHTHLSTPARARSHAHVHTHEYTLAHTHTCTCVHTHIHTSAHICTCMHAHTRALTHVHTHAHTCTHICTHAHTLMCTHAHVHTRAHTHAHTHVHTLPEDRLICRPSWPLPRVPLLCRLLHPALSPSLSGPSPELFQGPFCREPLGTASVRHLTQFTPRAPRRGAVSSRCPVRHEHLG